PTDTYVPPSRDARDAITPDIPKVTPDAACAAESAGAEAVPLALYMMIDSSRSMNTATSAGPSKWDAVRTAIKSFLDDPKSAGTAVGLAYFPGEQAGLPATCTSDSQCPGTVCDHRNQCVRTNTRTMSPPPTFCADATGCASDETCT